MIEHHRVIEIGAGPGGIAMSHALLQRGIDDFIVLEKASGPGGT
jgi:cation diffusion facilitator CzcD-associated flavoprotein CzcO